ncbi:MAG: hypothetical protein BKP49_01775 [Treponema sp. CETP13]|nr:MAG: hypothetical protein BKP49_01775 [Treponema sp. CETP13]
MNHKLHRFWYLVKHELFNYAISPTTYIAGIIYFLALASNFYFARSFFLLGSGSTDVRYFFLFIPYISIVFIPVLTMNFGGSGEEFIKQIPHSNFSIICARWLSASIIFFIWTLFSLFIPLSVIFFGDISLARLFCGFLCIMFFSFASIAFGQFVAHLTKNNVTTFIVTAISLAVINSIHLLPLKIHVPNFLLKIFNFCSFAWHFDAASKGIIDTRDYFFYGIVTVFLLIQVLWIDEKRAHSSHSVSARKVHYKHFIVSVSLFLSVFLINSQLFYKRIDVTSQKQFSLAPLTKELIQSLDEKLTITYYVSNNLRNLYPQVRDVQDLLGECASFSDSVSVEVITPENEDLQQQLKDVGLISQKIQTTDKNETSVSEVFSGVVFEYGTKKQIIPFVLSTTTFEYEIDSALQYFVSGIGRSVYIFCGGKDSLQEGYPYVQSWLSESGFTSLELTAELLTDTQKIDLRSPLLILGNSEITKDVAASIERFVMAGGKVFFAVSTILADRTTWNVSPIVANPLIEMLDYWGFSIKTALVEDQSNFRITMEAQDSNATQYIDYPFWIISQQANVSDSSPITNYFGGLELYWPSPMELFSTEILDIEPIVKSSTKSRIQIPSIQNDKDVNFETDPFAQSSGNSTNLDDGSFVQSTLVAAAKGSVKGWIATNQSKDTRIIVCSNQYFPSDMIEYTNSGYNLDFLTNCLLWLSGEDELLRVKAKGNVNTSLYKITDIDKMSQAETILIVCLFIYILFVVGGIALSVFIMRRNKKRFYCEK